MLSLKTSPRARAAAELELRRRRRDRAESGPSLDTFGPWLESASPTYIWTWPHLAFYVAQLDRVTRGEINRLMVSMPPRHGKTESGTIRYPVYRIERDPETRVIMGAYNATLAQKFSRKARRIARDRGIGLSTERAAVEDWETTAGGGVRAVGVGTGVAGHGADLIVLDDPTKSREEAESEAYRDRLFEWYTDDIYTRLEPGGSIVLTQTRWHVADLSGCILDSDDGPNWTVINLPAVAEVDDPLGREVGEPLCPERYDADALADRRRVLGEDGFVSLFQGRPRPAEGGRFKSSWFRYWEATPEGFYRLNHHDRDPEIVRPKLCSVFATVDSAVSEKTSADYTVISTWAVTRRADLLLLDRVRDRLNDPDAIEAMKRVHERWKPGYFAVESNGVGKARAQNARAAGLPVREVEVHTDKIARSGTAVVRCEAGQIFWPLDERHTWLREWEREHLDFPGAPHDDQVDTTSLAAADLYNAMAGTVAGAESVDLGDGRPVSGNRRWESLGGRTERRWG
jgi:predicted phage terminase large subunit-like protein